MDGEKRTTDAQRKAIYKYDEKFERINCRLPSGTLERIEKFNYKSSNAFIVSAVMDKLEREEKYLNKAQKKIEI